MKRTCPICNKNEYDICRLPRNETVGFSIYHIVKCNKCDFRYKPVEWIVAAFLVGLIITLIFATFFIIYLEDHWMISMLIFILFIIFIPIYSRFGEFLFIPFLNFKKLHKEHCHEHQAQSPETENINSD